MVVLEGLWWFGMVEEILEIVGNYGKGAWLRNSMG